MAASQINPIRILFVEDVDADAQLALAQLRRSGIECIAERVESEVALCAALEQFKPHVVLSDFNLPGFDGFEALRIVRLRASGTPFIFLSGTLAEEMAIEALEAGAVDYIAKGNSLRLVPAVARALHDVAVDAQRRVEHAQISHLSRVLNMTSNINALLGTKRDRTELMADACRIAVAFGGYTAAVAGFRVLGASTVKPVAWNSQNMALTDSLRSYLAESAGRPTGVISQVIKSGKESVSQRPGDLDKTTTLNDLMTSAGMRSVIVLPLIVEKVAVGVLVLVASASGMFEPEELVMLREIATSLSFALQAMHADTKVRFLSHYDSGTGLAKRSLFGERLARLIAEPGSDKNRHAVVVMDIEHLSAINDAFGRRIGDRMLKQVAERLRAHYVNVEHVGHFGGGTFALIREQGGRSEDEMIEVAHGKGNAVFAQPFMVDGVRIPVAIKSGFAVYPQDGHDAETLLQNAEAALLSAQAGVRRHAHFSPTLRSQIMGDLALEHQLREALAREEFELHYQPKVNVITRRIQGVEALLRWRMSTGVLASPAAFLPVLESSGLIVAVGDWVFQQAAKDCQAWMAAGLAPVRIAVNISPSQLRHVDFVSQFLNATKGWSSRAWGLDVEITEGVLQEESAAEIRKLKTLRSAGVKIAIDDFGTGYSSLSRLSSLPIDVLKIDRAFVKQALESASGATLVNTIVALARAFKMTTVAEGVERQEHLDFLWQAGCDQSQGYLHSPAVSADELAQFLKIGKGNLILPALEEETDASTGTDGI
ncbi:MAG: EAL domain-containing protein [Pseudomonadota bacterium]